MSEKFIGPQMPVSKKSAIDELVPDSVITGSNDLKNIFRVSQLELRNTKESTVSSLSDLKKQILSPTQNLRFDETSMPMSKIFDSCKGLYTRTLNSEKIYSQIMKDGLKISDGKDFLELKKSLTNTYARSLKRFNDINILIANFNRAGLNRSNKDPIWRGAYEKLVETKRIIEKTIKESKDMFDKTKEGLKAIELLKRIPELKNKMANLYDNVLYWQRQVKSEKNLDSERAKLKSNIFKLENEMLYSTKVAGAIKNLANQPNHPDAKALNSLVDDYKDKLIKPIKDSLTPQVEPARSTRENLATGGIRIEQKNGLTPAVEHIIDRWAGYLNMRAVDGGYFDYDLGRHGHPGYKTPALKKVEENGQCGVWVDVEIRSNPFYKDLLPIAYAPTNSYKEKKDAINLCPSPDGQPQVGGPVAINTGTYYGHIGFCHSVNSDGSVNIISSNAFGNEVVGNSFQYPSITTYRRDMCTFARAPRMI